MAKRDKKDSSVRPLWIARPSEKRSVRQLPPKEELERLIQETPDSGPTLADKKLIAAFDAPITPEVLRSLTQD